MLSEEEYMKLNNGIKCPVIGIGTYMLSPADAENSVREALKMGYSLVDTANAYLLGLLLPELFDQGRLWLRNYRLVLSFLTFWFLRFFWNIPYRIFLICSFNSSFVTVTASPLLGDLPLLGGFFNGNVLHFHYPFVCFKAYAKQ